MASHDAGWEAFREEFRHWMKLRGMTSRALAARLNELTVDQPFDEHVVKRWRHSTSPPLEAVRHIASLLTMSDDPSGQAPYDSAFILRRMGLLAPAAPAQELLDTSLRLQELRLRLSEVRGQLSRHAARTGAGQLVQTALSHGYAAAVFPVWEGPVGYPMHVADRIDFRTPRDDIPAVEENDEMLAALVANAAVPGTRHPRFSTQPDDLAEQSHWAIQLIGRPSMRNGKAIHPAAPAIAVTASTTSAWADDVGGIIAWLLGYGFVSTREIARELTRNPIATDALRSEVHDQFVARPPSHHVWSHHSVMVPEDNPNSPWAAADGTGSPGLVHIRLVEDHRLIEWTSEWLGGQLGMSAEEALTLAETTASTVEARLHSGALAHVRRRTLLVPTPFAETPAQRWENALGAALAATRFLAELGVERTDGLDAVHDRLLRDEPDIAHSLLRWLADHECPLVNPKFSSWSNRA